MNFPDDLKYTREHEWLRIEGDEVVVGITEFAQGELGDIVYVETPKIGDVLKQNQQFGVVESVKTVSDLFSPISGEVTAINEEVISTPELVNKDPYGEGWIIKIKPSDVGEQDNLLNAADYKTMIGK
jgi:glycine cleavage system H protein